MTTILFAPLLFVLALFGVGDDEDTEKTVLAGAIYFLVVLFGGAFALLKLTEARFFEQLGNAVAGVIRGWADIVKGVVGAIL